MLRFKEVGCRAAQGLCLLLMFASALVSMMLWGNLTTVTASVFGWAAGVFLWSAIALLFAFVFERSRTPRVTVRHMATRLGVVLVLAAGVAYLADWVWFAPERDAIDAQLRGPSCGQYTGTVEKGWELICAERRRREPN
ncbi:hypothetical protein [Pseudomonas sp. PWP3-1b2]|uniref:hypothetical protein n=1 Tax=Pseudomonas sp. PWP3-1b2 TaxID=2804656 RepID=UPI003CF4C91B